MDDQSQMTARRDATTSARRDIAEHIKRFDKMPVDFRATLIAAYVQHAANYGAKIIEQQLRLGLDNIQRGEVMTARTIKLVDTFIRAANWQSVIDTNRATLAEHGPHRAPEDHPWYEQLTRENTNWSALRDKALAKLRNVNDSLTDYEKDWVRRKCRGAELARDFHELGIEASWLPDPCA